MIFVTLGTQDKPFNRLVDSVIEYAKKNKSERIIIQAGFTKCESNIVEVYDFLEKEKFENCINECDILITHGGVGSILSGLKKGKKVIACSRLSKYGEHINDHQTDIVGSFSAQGLIFEFKEKDDLSNVIKSIRKMKIKSFVSNNEAFKKMLKNEIEKL